jgi:cytochrome c oxidase cbb3-type subunit 2
MPAYKHHFTNLADIDTAYAEAVTVRNIFKTPYDQEDMPQLGSLADSQATALEDAKAITAGMKNQAVKDAVANGQIPQIVALIAYLNSLK